MCAKAGFPVIDYSSGDREQDREQVSIWLLGEEIFSYKLDLFTIATHFPIAHN